jgi:predicted CoA-binding protein
MQRHFVIQRTNDHEWYDKAKRFLAENRCHPLVLEVSSDVDTVNVFQQALTSLNAIADQEFRIDHEADVIVVSADLSTTSAEARCACQCGTSTGTGQTCGGGGGGCKST